jgi:hypothetical protein
MSQGPDQTKTKGERIQLHLVLPFKFEPRENRRVRRYLEQGYRIEQFQRITDREAVVTLTNQP